MFTRILVPTDFSDPSDAALDYARALADKFGGSLHLLHVIEPVYARGAFSNEVYIGAAPGAYELLATDAQAKLADRVLPSDRTRYGTTTEVITGLSAETIVEYAADHHIDLIVMGTHGRTGLAHLVMGSVAEHVVRRALCPVLTVRYTPASDVPIVSPADRLSGNDR
jgi:nucleotide-binding universal stress UspA family protein